MEKKLNIYRYECPSHLVKGTDGKCRTKDNTPILKFQSDGIEDYFDIEEQFDYWLENDHHGLNEYLEQKNKKPEELTKNEKNTTYITEAGLYELIFHSKQKEAKNFKKHITHIILPSIRQTGMYSIHNTIQTNQCIKQHNVSLDTSDIK